MALEWRFPLPRAAAASARSLETSSKMQLPFLVWGWFASSLEEDREVQMCMTRIPQTDTWELFKVAVAPYPDDMVCIMLVTRKAPHVKSTGYHCMSWAWCSEKMRFCCLGSAMNTANLQHKFLKSGRVNQLILNPDEAFMAPWRSITPAKRPCSLKRERVLATALWLPK